MPTTPTKTAQEPRKRPGRPIGSTMPPELRKSVMLRVFVTPAQAEKYRALGAEEWFRATLDRARG